MKMPFSATTLWKYLLLTLNILITIVDVLLISCGVIALGSAGSIIGAYIVASVGFLVMAIAFLGSMASVRLGVIMSWAFIALTVGSIVLQTVFMIMFAAMKDTFTQMTVKRIEDFWDEEAAHPGAMDALQRQHHCCGKESPQDYLPDAAAVLPDSCCRHENCAQDGNIYAKGCLDVVVSFFDEQSDTMILILLGLIALQVLSAIAAYYMAGSIKTRVQKREQIIINE